MTEEWLKATGWRRDHFDPDDDDVQTWSIRDPGTDPVGDGLVTICDDGPLGWSAYFGGYDFDQWPRQSRTRGDVRRLLAALGVPLPAGAPPRGDNPPD